MVIEVLATSTRSDGRAGGGREKAFVMEVHCCMDGDGLA